MSTKKAKRFRAARTVALTIIGMFAFYVVTVGAIPAIGRHMADGRLQWMRDSSVASAALQVYGWPARYLEVLPTVRWLFELSADFWCAATHAPETTG
jgi:hypothetical protein